jgi:hypothetical protein
VKLSQKFNAVCALGALLATTLGCALTEREKEETVMQQYYRIDSQTILQSIAQGKTGVFTPVNERPETVPVSQRVSVDWGPEDYLQIAKAFQEEIWGESLEPWQLHSVSYALNCAEVGRGFQDARLEFFSVVPMGDRQARLVHFLDIDPRNNLVFAWEREFYPQVRDWPFVGHGENTFSAGDILQIAESNGGRDQRLSIQDACAIDVLISPDSVSFDGWLVAYSRFGEPQPFLEIEIDPNTGEIIRSKERP